MPKTIKNKKEICIQTASPAKRPNADTTFLHSQEDLINGLREQTIKTPNEQNKKQTNKQRTTKTYLSVSKLMNELISFYFP